MFGRAALTVVLGVIGFIIAAIGLNHVDAYQNVLLVTAYWIGPWLGIVLADRIFFRQPIPNAVFINHRYVNLAGPIAMIVGIIVSVALFANQTIFVAIMPTKFPGLGDIAFEVGFVLSAVLYVALRKIVQPRIPDFVAPPATPRPVVASA